MMVASFPRPADDPVRTLAGGAEAFPEADEAIALLKGAVTALRTLRSEYHVPPSAALSAGLAGLRPAQGELLRRLAPSVESLAALSALAFAESLRPGAVQSHQLGAADQAVPAEGNELGVRGAPALERHRPLLRTAEVEQRVARADDAAVDDTGDERPDLAARHGDHHLVEQR